MGAHIRISGPGVFPAGQGKQTLQDLIAALANEKEEVCAKPPIRWWQVLGLTVTVAISAGCWALIIALLLR
jgi:hypothetical protein